MLLPCLASTTRKACPTTGAIAPYSALTLGFSICRNRGIPTDDFSHIFSRLRKSQRRLPAKRTICEQETGRHPNKSSREVSMQVSAPANRQKTEQHPNNIRTILKIGTIQSDLLIFKKKSSHPGSVHR
jgi:hypothetical protein